MTLPSPELDDRRFDDLVREARALIRARCPQWTDLGPSDPGMVLVEVFAHLTELTTYRLNRVPEKVQVELLGLLGVEPFAPTAAHARLRFARVDPGPRVEIPVGMQVSAAGGPVFTTVQGAVLEPEALEVEVPALHAERVEGRQLGTGDGRAGQSIRVDDDALIAPLDELPFVIGVEAVESELEQATLQHDDRAFVAYSEVTSFGGIREADRVFVLSRASGILRFAPARGTGAEDATAPIAVVPGHGRQIRGWYPRGGGAEGNVAAASLTRILSRAPGHAELTVTNPEPARGGRARESVAEAIRRGPTAFRSRDRAVTADDIEGLAREASREVNRARAVTSVDVWRHAIPGTVEVLLVPNLARPPASPAEITLEALVAAQDEAARRRVEVFLEARRSLGSRVFVRWARFSRVSVRATVSPHPGANRTELRERLIRRLHESIQPFDHVDRPGWRFGEPLRAAHVWRIILGEPGVDYVENVHFEVDAHPLHLETLERDPAQPQGWFAGGRSGLFRTTNDAASWERLGAFDGRTVTDIARDPDAPGLLAVAILGEDLTSEVRISVDAGESWAPGRHVMRHRVHDLAWIRRSGQPVLLMATDVGLYEVATDPGATPLQLIVDPERPQLGFRSVIGVIGARGEVKVATAAIGVGGVYLSADGGGLERFEGIGLDHEDVRVLAAETDGPRTFLWAGLGAVGKDDPGEGCRVWELTGSGRAVDGWTSLSEGWRGGSCTDLAFHQLEDQTVAVAGSHRAGVLVLGPGRRGRAWQSPSLDSGLPLMTAERLFEPVAAVAAGGGWVLSGSDSGIFRRRDDAAGGFVNVSSTRRHEVVHLPPTWLFCSGAHEIAWKND